MSLSDLVIETQDVIVNGKTLFTVRGLCFNDITTLIRLYGDDLDKVIDTFKNGDNDSGIEDSEMIEVALKEAPLVVSHAIALAANEPDQFDKVKTLGISTQLEAVKLIWKLTVDESGGLKKLIDNLMQLTNQVKGDWSEAQSIGTS